MSGNISVKGFSSFQVNDTLLAKVVEAIKAGEADARRYSQVRSFEIYYEGFRERMVFGRVMIVPAKIADSLEDFPSALLYGAMVKEISPENQADLYSYKLGEGEFDEYAKRDLAVIKDKLFLDAEGKYRSIVIFVPTWANVRDYVMFKYTRNPEALLSMVRHQIYGAYFDPALSSAFDHLSNDTEKLNVSDITPKQDYPGFSEGEKAYPVLEAGDGGSKTASARKPRMLLAKDTVNEINEEFLEPGEKAVIDELAEELKAKVDGDIEEPREVAKQAAPQPEDFQNKKQLMSPNGDYHHWYYQCSGCKKGFNSEEQLRDHQCSADRGPQTSQAPEDWDKPVQLLNDFGNYEDFYQCSDCKARFKTPDELKAHKEVCTKKGEGAKRQEMLKSLPPRRRSASEDTGLRNRPDYGEADSHTSEMNEAASKDASKKAAHVPDLEADAYIEWGGAYDRRRLELDGYQGTWEWTDDDASEALNLGDQVGPCSSMDEAKNKLQEEVFAIGEPNSYVVFYEDGGEKIIRKKDYLKPSEQKFLSDVGVDGDVTADFNEGPGYTNGNTTNRDDKELLKSMGIKAAKKCEKHGLPNCIPCTSDKVSSRLCKEHGVADCADCKKSDQSKKASETTVKTADQFPNFDKQREENANYQTPEQTRKDWEVEFGTADLTTLEKAKYNVKALLDSPAAKSLTSQDRQDRLTLLAFLDKLIADRKSKQASNTVIAMEGSKLVVAGAKLVAEAKTGHKEALLINGKKIKWQRPQQFTSAFRAAAETYIRNPRNASAKKADVPMTFDAIWNSIATDFGPAPVVETKAAPAQKSEPTEPKKPSSPAPAAADGKAEPKEKSEPAPEKGGSSDEPKEEKSEEKSKEARLLTEKEVREVGKCALDEAKAKGKCAFCEQPTAKGEGLCKTHLEASSRKQAMLECDYCGGPSGESMCKNCKKTLKCGICGKTLGEGKGDFSEVAPDKFEHAACKTMAKAAAFDMFIPGQVLNEFYPEVLRETVDYPSDTFSTETVSPAGLPPEGTPYISTDPTAAMGIGNNGKSQVLDGVPLRQENDIRGYMFDQEYYTQHEGVDPKAFVAAYAVDSINKKASTEEFAAQFATFLKRAMGEVAATFIAAFKATSRPIMNRVPGTGEIKLDQCEQIATFPAGSTLQVASRVAYLMGKLTDSQIQDAINNSWAAAAVYNEDPNGGYTYEVFVRPSSIDKNTMVLAYEFVVGTKGM